MKNAKRILAVLMCALLMLGSISVTAFADAKGSIIVSGTDSGATVAGKTLHLYKIFEAKTSGVNTSYDWVIQNEENVYYDFFYGPEGKVDTNKTNGSVQGAVDYIAGMQENALSLSQLATALHDYIHAKNEASEGYIEAVETKTLGDEATTATFSNLDFGYYLIQDHSALTGSAVRSATILVNVKATDPVNVTLKANRPQLEKTVFSNEETWLKGTSADVGDTITFKLATAVPDHSLYTSYTYRIEDDLPDALDFTQEKFGAVANSVTLKIGDNTITGENLHNYLSVTHNDAENAEYDLLFEFKDIKNIEKYPVDAIVEITYDVVFNPVGHTGNTFTNKAKLVYSNDPAAVNTTGSVSSQAKVYTLAMTLSKYAETADGSVITDTMLKGAEYKVYKETDGAKELMKFIPYEFSDANTSKNYTVYMVVPTDYQNERVVDIVKTYDLENGAIGIGDTKIWGFAEGTYYIEEIKAPDGYILPNGFFKLEINDGIDPAGNLSQLITTGSHEAVNYGTIVVTSSDHRTHSITAEIGNRPGTALPETGGMGTTLFTILGIILMAGAAAYLIIRRKKSVA